MSWGFGKITVAWKWQTGCCPCVENNLKDGSFHLAPSELTPTGYTRLCSGWRLRSPCRLSYIWCTEGKEEEWTKKAAQVRDHLVDSEPLNSWKKNQTFFSIILQNVLLIFHLVMLKISLCSILRTNSRIFTDWTRRNHGLPNFRGHFNPNMYFCSGKSKHLWQRDHEIAENRTC